MIADVIQQYCLCSLKELIIFFIYNELWNNWLKMVLINQTFIILSVCLLIYLSWHYMLYDMTMDPVAIWSVADVFMLFIMWAIMMAGMMLSSAIPVILLVNKLNRQRISSNKTYTATIIFTFGYIIILCLYSVVITFLQYFLHHLGLLTPMMDSAKRS